MSKCHKTNQRLTFFCALALSLPLSLSATAGEKVTLTSLDWAPYTSADAAQQGASSAVAKAAFAAAGYDLTIEFYPWKRAVHLAKEDAAYDGYFPEYYAEELKADFIFSEPMGSGPLGFAQATAKPISWNTLADLKKYQIGVVSGFVNTAEFDDMAAKGLLQTSAASDDAKNLLKLASGRLDLAVIDKNILAHLLKTDSSLKSAAGKIAFNDHVLEDKQLYICFKKGARGQKLAAAFKEGIKAVDVNKIMAEFF
jgi:polar amino acid transport system substrate-binding protein